MTIRPRLVTVEEGSVEVRHLLKPGNTRIVNEGETLEVYKNEPLAKSRIDKGGLAQRILHAAADAARVAIIQGRQAAGTVGTGPGGPTLPGETAPPPPPTGPPPPPSAPPPPPH